jgi:hypothetical protein
VRRAAASLVCGDVTRYDRWEPIFVIVAAAVLLIARC